MTAFTRVSFIILFSFALHAHSGYSQDRAGIIDKYFSTLAANKQFNGNVLIAEKGRIIYEKSFGYADYSLQKPNTLSTSFPIASITKTFTSTAILQLSEKGSLELLDNYAKYFPSFPYPSVTIRQLLSHTSRIPSSSFYRFADSLRKIRDTFFTNGDVIPALSKMNMPLVGKEEPEGSRAAFAYSNVNFYLLALLIEKLSGMPYNSYLKKYIFLPAGMENSSLSEFYFAIDKKVCKEQRYRYLFSDEPESIDTVSENAYIFRTYNFKGHGDVVSTVHDLLKYSSALTAGALVKNSTLLKAYEPIVPGGAGYSGYGLGWSILHDSTKGKIVFHHGGGMGIEGMLVRNITSDQTIIVLDNSKHYAFDKALDVLRMLNHEKVKIPGASLARLYGVSLIKNGIPEAEKLLHRFREDTVRYRLSEYEMNLLGYQLAENDLAEKALAVFKTNVALFPASWNVYDSYGEMLLRTGRREEAIAMYEKSIQLNPKNEHGRKVLKEIAR